MPQKVGISWSLYGARSVFTVDLRLFWFNGILKSTTKWKLVIFDLICNASKAEETRARNLWFSITNNLRKRIKYLVLIPFLWPNTVQTKSYQTCFLGKVVNLSCSVSFNLYHTDKILPNILLGKGFELEKESTIHCLCFVTHGLNRTPGLGQ